MSCFINRKHKWYWMLKCYLRLNSVVIFTALPCTFVMILLIPQVKFVLLVCLWMHDKVEDSIKTFLCRLITGCEMVMANSYFATQINSGRPIKLLLRHLFNYKNYCILYRFCFNFNCTVWVIASKQQETQPLLLLMCC